MKYFGTDGFRGEANCTLTADQAYKVGRFLGFYYKVMHDSVNNFDRPKIVIGKDTRRSSYMFEYMLAGGIVASGADAYLMHVTTTPSVSYITRVDKFDCGIMITASHNPYYDNGIKILNSNGEKLSDDVLEICEDYLDNNLDAMFNKLVDKFNSCLGVDSYPTLLKEVIDNKIDIPLALSTEIGIINDYASGRNRYIGYLISLSKYSFKHIKVGLDCANGSSWMIAKSVFESLGADVTVINNKPDGTNINVDAGSTHIEHLQSLVTKNRLDIGFAFDGDADRCLCVDEKGNVLTGDHIIFMYGKYLKEHDKLTSNTIVATVMSNLGLFKACEKYGINCVKTNVGDRYVYEEMKANGYRLGGEQSGHVIFSKYASTGDGILTALKIMELMISSKAPISKLAEEMPLYPQTLINVNVTDKVASINNFRVKEAINEATNKLGDKGRILVRPSGTEPKIRVMVEAESQDMCDLIASEVADCIKSTS